MTFLELFTRQHPYSNIPHDFNVIGELKKYKTPKRPSGQAVVGAGLDDDMWELLEQCWRRKPVDRPTAKAVMVSLARNQPSCECMSTTT